MDTLDLHGIRHEDVELTTENFVLISDSPFCIITGNSDKMLQLVKPILEKHGFVWDYESHLNLGAIVCHDS